MHKKNLFRLPAAGPLDVPSLGGLSRVLSQDTVHREEMNSMGWTLIELIVVITIIGSLAAPLVFSYTDWMGKYKVEKATNELYADLMNVRSMAVTKNCDHFVDFNFPAPASGKGTYRIAEDTNDDSEGDHDANGIIDAGGHTFFPSSPKTVEYPITFSKRIINFKKIGLVQPRGQAAGGTICFYSDDDPDYDCIVISPTRISIGKLKKQPGKGGACDADNCRRK